MVWALATAFSLPAAAQSVLDLGSLGAETSAYAISSDGRTVVGSSLVGSGSSRYNRAYRWTEKEGMQDMQLPAVETTAMGVSGDGSVIVGKFYDLGIGSGRVFRWTAAGGMQDIGTLGGRTSYDAAVSNDGSTIVGASLPATGDRRAFRWTAAGGMENLGVLGTGTYSHARGVSADGSVVVGYSTTAFGSSERAFRWTSAGMVDLGTLGGPQSHANAVSGDGTVVVGDSQLVSAGPVQAYRWTQATGMQSLGSLGAYAGNSTASGISLDGKVIVGYTPDAGTFLRAFRWTEGTGMQSVAAWLASNGASSAGWDLSSATSTNEDGSVVVGFGSRTGTSGSRAYIARVSPFGSGVMQPDNYVQSTMVLNQAWAQANQHLTRTVMWGGHHRPLGSYKLNGQSCFWATGDLGRTGNERAATNTAGEFGLCRDFAGGAVRAGIGLGFGKQSLNAGDFGSVKTGGNHVVAEVNYQTTVGPLLSVTGMYGQWNADVSRGYTGGAGTDYSRGSADVKATALRLRADWNDAWKMGATALSPYAALTATRTTTDGYTESGGGFPARFDAQTQTGLEARLGVAAGFPLSPATHLRATVEGIRRLDGDTPRTSGQVLGLFSFNQPGLSETKTWMRAGVDIDHQITNNTLLGFSVHAASRGDDPRLTAAVTLRVGF